MKKKPRIDWPVLKEKFLNYYNLDKDMIQSEINIMGGYAPFIKKYPFKNLNHMRLFKFLEIEKPKSILCSICGKIFENENSDGNLISRLARHTIMCKSKHDFIKKYNITKEFLEIEYEELGSILEFSKKYSEIPFGMCYELFKEFNIEVTFSKSLGNKKTQGRRAKNNIEKYGVPHNFCKEHPSRIGWQQKMLEEEGITTVFQRESVKEKSLETFLNKYGKERWLHSLTVRGNGVVSKVNKIVFNILDEIHIEYTIEFKVKRDKSYYAYDILIEPNKIIEVYGDYWHGNPVVYKENDLILKGSSGEIKVKDKWDLDKKKIDFIKNQEYDVLIVWEKSLKEDFENEKEKIKQYATSKNSFNKENSEKR